MKKIFTVLMIMGLLMSMIFTAAFAQEERNPEITVEKAIEIAKGFFPETKNFNKFDSSFEQNEYADIWALRWYHEKGDGNLNVQVNAATGEIVGFNLYDPADYTGTFSNIPKVSREAGEKIARDFIKKVAPSKVGAFILKPNNDSYYYGSGPVFHHYNFTRTIKGIEYPANTIQVTVNAQTGAVRNVNFNWEEITLEPLVAKLTREDAEKIFTEKYGFELKYFKPQSDGKAMKPIKTIYEINNPYQVTIDALNGEIVQDRNYYTIYDRDAGGEEVAQEKSMNSSLEPFEQEIADELNALISREKAMEIAEKTITISKDYKLNSSSLNRDWNFPELRIWSFHWTLEAKDRYGWASVEIDAKTGKVMSFNYREPEEINQQSEKRPFKVKNRSEAEKIVENYLKENYPEVVGNLRVKSDNYDVIPLNLEAEKNQASYYFRYERLVDGIPFSQNYVYANVDSFTGKITSFQIRFLDLEFPKTDNVLNQAQFTGDFLGENPMILVYTKDQDQNLRLVYKLAPINSYRFDAVSGKMLDYGGEPIPEKKAGEITDIKGHWAESDINILNQMGFLHYEEGIFQPNAAMTQAEVIKALVKSTYNYLTDSGEGNWYDNYYREAKRMGLILEKEINPTAKITREQMAKFITRTMVKDKISGLEIYQVPYKDGAKITKGYQGYVAIVGGLGIMTGDGTNFHPQNEIKKGEACVVLVRYLKTER
ncbi:MAG: S-layer homology domain-containing protein [Bacillota bacterium]|jgi:uncharacterized membrane protein YkoI